jgi:hypothetical protein
MFFSEAGCLFERDTPAIAVYCFLEKRKSGFFSLEKLLVGLP